MSQTNQVTTLMKTSDGNYLVHYGVPGMKWGHRKAKYYSNKASRNYKKSAKEIQKNNGQWNKKATKSFIKADKSRAKAIINAYNSNLKYRNKTAKEAKLLKTDIGHRTAKKRIKVGTLIAGIPGGMTAYALTRYKATKNPQKMLKKERKKLLKEARKWNKTYQANEDILKKWEFDIKKVKKISS